MLDQLMRLHLELNNGSQFGYLDEQPSDPSQRYDVEVQSSVDYHRYADDIQLYISALWCFLNKMHDSEQ